MTAQELRAERISQGISARLLAPRAKVSCSRLSDIERGYVAPSADELARIARSLKDLIVARRKLRAVAEEVGWPAGSI